MYKKTPVIFISMIAMMLSCNSSDSNESKEKVSDPESTTTDTKKPVSENNPTAVTGTEIGNIAIDLTMNDMNGKPFSLSDLRGKYVLVDFWASWCGPCRGENPNVVAAYNEFKDKNFTVLGVSLDEEKNAWIDAVMEDHLTWNHISDLKGWYSDAVSKYHFEGIPYNVLIDPNGKILAKELRGNDLRAFLEKTLP